MSIDDEIKYKEESKAHLKLQDDDPKAAILGPAKIRTQYTYEKLLSYRHSPIVKQRPECLSEEFCNEEGTWDPELWHASMSGGKKSRPTSRSSSPAFSLEFRPSRKASDPKERLKQQEQDGIILSPQRRSFGHGCQITFPSSLASDHRTTDHRTTRPKSPLEKDYRDTMVNGRPIPGRRRVITRPSRETLMEQERLREREVKGYDSRDSNSRYQRRGSFERQDSRPAKNEPEWLTDIPTSNLEQIELHGFGAAEEAERSEVRGDHRRDSHSKEPTELDHLVASLQSNSRGEQQQRVTTPSKEFDINDFFNFSEPISTSPLEEQGLTQSRFSHLFNVAPSLDGQSSWGSSRRSSLHKDELEFLQELRNSGSESDAGSTPIHALINDTPESTPFTLLEMLQRGQENADVENDMRKREVQLKLMEGQAKSLAEIEAELKNDSIQKRRRSSGSLPPLARGGSPAASSEDQTAFNNFLATLSKERKSSRESPLTGSMTPDVGSRHSPAAVLFQNGPSDARVPSRHSPELAHLTDQYVRSELEEIHNRSARGVSPHNRGSLMDMLNTPQQSAASSETSFLQRQSPMTPDQLASILQQQIAANHRQHAVNQEVLANVVKQAVVTNPDLVASILSQNAARGQQRAISPQERYQQALLQQQAAVQRGHSPLVTSPLGFVGTQSPLTPSPLPGGIPSPLGPASHLIPPPPMGVAVPPPGAHQPSPIRPRIPSPQELVKHTQNILQQALIKRQLEVQREKFYARERETRTRSPIPGTPGQGQRRRTPPVTPTTKTSSTVMTAFTPTSVIRRMHDTKAEAEEAKAKQSPDITEKAQLEGQEGSKQHIPPDPVGSPLRKQDRLDPVTPQSGHASPVKGKDSTVLGQPGSPHSVYPQQLGSPPKQPDFGSPEQKDRGRGDATEGSKDNDRTVKNDKGTTNPDKPLLDNKSIAAKGDMVPPRPSQNGVGTNSGPGQHQIGSQPPAVNRPQGSSQPLGVTRPPGVSHPPGISPLPGISQPPGLNQSRVGHPTGVGEPQGVVRQPPGISHPMGDSKPPGTVIQPHGGVSQRPGGLSQPPAMSGAGSKQQGPTSPATPRDGTQAGAEQPQGHSRQGPMGAQQQQLTGGPQDPLRPMMRMPNPPPRPHMMQTRPPVTPQFPVMHPAAQRLPPMGTPMHPMAQQNMMRGMMYTVPPPRAPTVPAAVNPMAFLAMQQLNQRAVMNQMQMPTAPSPIPSTQGVQRTMLPPQFPSQQVLHHPNSMGMPMVAPRNLHLPQMGPPPRMPLQQQGISNDIGSHMEHQRSPLFPMPAAPPTSTNTPLSPENPLTKWFGNDILKHPHVTQPPRVPEGLKVLSVEELERQQQQAVS